jgi:hypothetical protein
MADIIGDNVLQYDLLDMVVDHTSHRILNALNSVAPRSQQLSFSYRDNLKGVCRVVAQSGKTTAPLTRLSAQVTRLAITDGISVIYADATNLVQVNWPNGPDPRTVFRLLIDSAALVSAFDASPTSPSISAVVEVKFTMQSTNDGGFTMTQTEHVVREACTVFQTALDQHGL